MNAVISSRTPEGEPFLCPICGASDRIEASRPPGDTPCPSCGHLNWLSADPAVQAVDRINPAEITRYLRISRRRPMFGVRATISLGLERLVRTTRRRLTRVSDPESAGVYDHWLDG